MKSASMARKKEERRQARVAKRGMKSVDAVLTAAKVAKLLNNYKRGVRHKSEDAEFVDSLFAKRRLKLEE